MQRGIKKCRVLCALIATVAVFMFTLPALAAPPTGPPAGDEATLVIDVKSAGGTPLSGATVTAKNTVTGYEATGTANPSVSLTVQRGLQNVTVSMSGYKTLTRQVDAPAAGPYSDTFTLEPVTVTAYAFTGNVFDQSNKPIQNATVTVGGKSSTTNLAGAFEIKDLPVGSYQGTITHPNYPAKTFAVNITGNLHQYIYMDTATVTVAAPVIKPVYAGATLVKGTGTAGHVITVIFPGGGKVTSTIAAAGTWSVAVPTDLTLAAGNVVQAYQASTVNAVNQSATVSVTVLPKVPKTADNPAPWGAYLALGALGFAALMLATGRKGSFTH